MVGANLGCNAPEFSFQAGGPFAPGRAVIAQSGGTGAWDALSRSCRVLQEEMEQPTWAGAQNHQQKFWGGCSQPPKPSWMGTYCNLR